MTKKTLPRRQLRGNKIKPQNDEDPDAPYEVCLMPRRDFTRAELGGREQQKRAA